MALLSVSSCKQATFEFGQSIQKEATFLLQFVDAETGMDLLDLHSYSIEDYSIVPQLDRIYIEQRHGLNLMLVQYYRDAQLTLQLDTLSYDLSFITGDV